jgi:flavin reductase (DIM6/NTAB) family NADH-FMN oxidoreductase RutF/rubredoxin
MKMKKWLCRICGYEHEGSAPPEECPICGVGPEEFTQMEVKVSPQVATPKRWKCTVCDYVHDGDEPPETCPLCGVGKELFVLLEGRVIELSPETVYKTNESTIRAALDKISYGLYVVTSIKDNKINGQCSNTVFQLTDKPLQLSVCLNKNNLTYEYIEQSGVLAISLLEQNDLEMVHTFGYKSGRNVDKFAEIEYISGQNGCPILKKCAAYLEGRILRDKIVDVGTHSLFVVDVTAGMTISDQRPLTYLHFREHKNK